MAALRNEASFALLRPIVLRLTHLLKRCSQVYCGLHLVRIVQGAASGKKQFYGSLLLFLCLHALNVVPLHLSLDRFLGALLMELFFQVGYSLHCVLYLGVSDDSRTCDDERVRVTHVHNHFDTWIRYLMTR